MCDVAIVSVPYYDSDYPPAAPAVLASVCADNGLSSHYFDLNIDTRKNKDIINFCVGTETDIFEVNRYFSNMAEEILKKKPKYVCISVLTYRGMNAAMALCIAIRTKDTNAKIILGGLGLHPTGLGSKSAGQHMLNIGLCDYYVSGDGEIALDNLFKDVGNIGINTHEWKQIENLDDVFIYPNYDSYNFDLYSHRRIPITGSRGCVRRCTFCDIHSHWKKFVFRSGKSIAKEMSYISDKYDANFFWFTDSLVNGSMKAYREMIDELVELDKNLKWAGQFILRPKNQMTEEEWEKTAKSGGSNLSIGIESLDEEVRNHMLKKFSNDDILYGLSMMKKYKIQCTFLMIVGYVIETEQHFKNTLDMFERLVEYKGDVISSVAVGSTLGILPNTPLSVYNNGTNENNWVYGDNTLEVRIGRLNRLKDHLTNLGYNIIDNTEFDSLVNSWQAQ